MPTPWKQRKEYNREWCRAYRSRLVEQLGGCCQQCGSTEKLQFHHLKPRTWIASQLSRWQRLAEYKREISRGEIELLCKPCNQRAGKPQAEPDPNFVPDF